MSADDTLIMLYSSIVVSILTIGLNVFTIGIHKGWFDAAIDRRASRRDRKRS